MNNVLQKFGEADSAKLRHDLREGNSLAILLRYAAIGASLIGMAAMAVTTLFQSGMIKHLKDPPVKGFDSDKVNASDTAYGWGMPDSPISIAAHSASLALATTGSEDRAQKQPWLPLLATAVALPPAVTAAKYLFYQMPVKEKGWCPYCIADALMHMAVLGFSGWEAKKAITALAEGKAVIKSRLVHFELDTSIGAERGDKV
jgi:uncharacterized membrane protein